MMINEICDSNSGVHILLLALVFLWEHALSLTKFGSTLGLIYKSLKKEK